MVADRQLILQSGGKNAALVHSSAEMDTAIKCVLMGALKSAGQLCTSTSRVFVHRTRLAEFNECLTQKINELPIGRTDLPLQKNERQPFLGPLYSQKAAEKFLRYQTMAHREAKLDLLWGKAVESEAGGYFVRPGVHLIEKFDKASGYQGNVLFCPDIAIYEYDVLDEAIDQINSTDAPYVVSYIGDPEIIHARKTQFLAPNLLINLPTTEVEHIPFPAGRFKTGNHRYNGAALALLLSFPSLIHSADSKPNSLSCWPWGDN
jgi:aldehyde dehydrogenase (NAD+)